MNVKSYRSYKHNFTTNPITVPDLVVKDDVAYMSWNGATRVAWWDVFSGRNSNELSLVGRIKKKGFETSFSFPARYDASIYFTKVEALDADGNTLMSSKVVRVEHESDFKPDSQKVLKHSCAPDSNSLLDVLLL